MPPGSRSGISTSSSPTAPRLSAATARSTPRASRPSSPRHGRADCAPGRARPAWTATPRPKACATRRSPPTMTADGFWSAGMGSTGSPTSSPRASRPPRFAPHATPEQLSALGALWAENPSCLMQTHLSEQTDEIAWVKSLYPEARDYLDTYETHGLLGPGGLFGHAIHLEPRERDRLREVDASLIHCPTSNTFIGSGLFDMDGLARAGERIGLATDTGGGSSFSMLRTLAAAYEVAQLRHRALHPAELWWLATQGSARALRADDRIGNLAPGMEADIVAIDLSSTPAIAQRAAQAEDIWEALFPTIMMGDDRAIATVWIGGRRVARPA